jgi:hypothetical protein
MKPYVLKRYSMTCSLTNKASKMGKYFSSVTICISEQSGSRSLAVIPTLEPMMRSLLPCGFGSLAVK